jgi:hypothetical protein
VPITINKQANKSGKYAGFANFALFGAVSVFMKTPPIEFERFGNGLRNNRPQRTLAKIIAARVYHLLLRQEVAFLGLFDENKKA